jgi:hypothetical protein
MTTFVTVRERFFLEKTGLFLKGFEDINEEFRSKLDKTISDQKYKDNLENWLIIALDRFDDLAKVDALFKIFVAHINNEIDQQEFLRYLYVLDKIDYYNLKAFVEFYISTAEVTSDSGLNSFAFVGLLRLINNLDIIAFGKNEFGTKFLEILGLLD